MGFDVSYHPVKEIEIKEWYFDVLANPDRIFSLGEKYNIDDFYLKKYQDTIKIAIESNTESSFEVTHGFYIAVVHGFFRTFYYTRGSAFSFLIEEKPYFERYTKSLNGLIPETITNPVHHKIVENYSGGVFIPADKVTALLEDYQNNPNVKADLNAHFSYKRISVFLNALEDSRKQHAGLLEATEVVEPNPINLNESSCYSNLFNCDREGPYLYEEAALEQFRNIEIENNLMPGSLSKKVAFEQMIMPGQENESQVIKAESESQQGAVLPNQPSAKKKGFWNRLFGA